MPIEKLTAAFAKERYPDVYNEIFEAGRKAGSAKAEADSYYAEYEKEKEAQAARIAHAQRVASYKTASYEPTEKFMDKVEKYKAEHNCKMSVAVKAIAIAFPDLHKAYIKETNS